MSDILNKAAKYIQAGDLIAAKSLCLEYSAYSPNDPAVYHFLSAVEFQTGNYWDALLIIARAQVLGPELPFIWFNSAEILRCADPIANNPTKWWLRAIMLVPNYFEAHWNIALYFMQQHDHELAAGHFAKAISIHPAFAVIHAQAAENSAAAMDIDQSYYHIAASIALEPGQGKFLRVAFDILFRQGIQSADRYAYRLMVLDIDDAHSHMSMGVVAMKRGALLQASMSLATALVLQPEAPGASSNLSICLRQQSKLALALSWATRSVAVSSSSELLLNLGRAQADIGEVEAAIATYDRGLRADPTSVNLHWNRSNALLLSGRLVDGFEAYEWRRHLPEYSMFEKMLSHIPRLKDDESPRGQHILVFAEQGFGDTFQFCRYLPLLIERGARVTFYCPPELVRILSRLHAGLALVSQLYSGVQYDRCIGLLSLPNYFRTSLATIPNKRGYLSSHSQFKSLWHNRMEHYPRPLIGLAWAGGSRPTAAVEIQSADWRRSLDAGQLLPLGKIKFCTFISLQKGRPKSESRLLFEQLGLVDFSDDITDFEDTAALITNLDLVITVDTSIAHLAGGLGKTVWLLNRYDTCWRWMLATDRSPWYPSMRIFRQQTPGGWDGVLGDVKNALARFVSTRNAGP